MQEAVLNQNRPQTGSSNIKITFGLNQNLRIDHPSKKENQKMLDPRQQKQTFIDPAVVNRLPAIVKQKFEERLEDFSQAQVGSYSNGKRR